MSSSKLFEYTMWPQLNKKKNKIKNQSHIRSNLFIKITSKCIPLMFDRIKLQIVSVDDKNTIQK